MHYRARYAIFIPRSGVADAWNYSVNVPGKTQSSAAVIVT